MFRVPRRLFATVGAVATILMLTTSAVSAADPDSPASARRSGSSAGVSVTLGAKSHISRDAGPARLRLDHGGGLQPPATDVETGPFDAQAPAPGVGVALATWALLFLAGVLASLRYMARRSGL